ncbi:MAG: hypothetical protein ACXWPM_04665 [Bdellovibrionota bacterium]
MEVSNREEMKQEPDGQALIEKVVDLTGLPSEMAHEELQKILEFSGHDGEELTLDQLRQSLVTYLESMQSEFESESELT